MAYANLVEIIRHKTPEGFFPNYAMGYGIASRDRSQPPVYSWVAKELYSKYKERWLLEIVFPHLLDNNRWWHHNRSYEGFLCWGSSPIIMDWDAHTKKAAMFESGLDNSPMFDDVPFDTSRHIMMQGDVGLMSLYIRDCEALATIAEWLGKSDIKTELAGRAATYKAKLATMWDEKTGLYLNWRLDTRCFNPRISPTNFYPLLVGIPDAGKAARMVKEHLLNPNEFYGQWMLPSIARNDPAYKDQSYWRGRIWPPMNMFVYMGLKNYGFNEEARVLAGKSNQLLLKEYLKGNWIRENFHADHGDGTPCTNKCFGGSDCYYTWGTLMAIPMMMEKGIFQKQ
ncbi:hypothetical protein L0U88_03560 [Flavihumibacter sp. RY-1]|uniref:Mannosylglycerate hydrolase MGH1-like glycoside hydrolase domain-containing protein n=1 Tax=Flavihumibacter fluminis TaxID=2909236 RepID=A0ABS9BDC7_9BACT|nr:trehalase family glycosidase [Flavihumibacter fluminis]MCF1713706.1 hypothetical protein [Flavihumibacter fluminis]